MPVRLTGQATIRNLTPQISLSCQNACVIPKRIVLGYTPISGEKPSTTPVSFLFIDLSQPASTHCSRLSGLKDVRNTSNAKGLWWASRRDHFFAALHVLNDCMIRLSNSILSESLVCFTTGCTSKNPTLGRLQNIYFKLKMSLSFK